VTVTDPTHPTDPRVDPAPGVVRVLVADDQKIVRDGLAMLLGLLPGIEVVGVAIDGDDALRQVAGLDPDVVLMDLHMPGCNGVEATDALTTSGARARVVVLTTYADDDWVFAALRAGARGFLTKDAGAEEIRHALTTVAAGQAQLDPSVQRRLLEALATGSRVATAVDVPPAAGPPSQAPDGLTPREVEVLVRIAGGESNAEVAASLFVSEATVKTHVNHLLAKTAMRDRAQLVGYAFRRGLVTP
jgi:DNA-binding NarL/FixJ family response regulator